MAFLGAQTLGACLLVCQSWNTIFKKDEFWKRIFEEKNWIGPSPGKSYYSFHCDNRVEVNAASDGASWALTAENLALYQRAFAYAEAMKEQHSASEGMTRAIGDFSHTLAQPQFIDAIVSTCSSDKIQSYIDDFARIQAWLQDAKNRRLEKEQGSIDEAELLHEHLSKKLRTSEHRVLLAGLDNAGKTTLLYRLHLGENVTTIPTIGFNVESVRHQGKSFTVWDVGGQDKIRPLWRHYTANSQVVLYVINPTDRVELAFKELNLLATSFVDDHGPHADHPLLVIAVSHWDQVLDFQKEAILANIKKSAGQVMLKYPKLWSKCRVETYTIQETTPTHILDAMATQLNPIKDNDFDEYHAAVASARERQKNKK